MPVFDAARIRAAFQKAKADDGKIDGAEAKRIINSVRADRLTESEAKALKREVARFKASFTRDAKQTFDKFIDGTMKRIEVLDPAHRHHDGPGPLHDPAVLKLDRDKLEWQSVKGGVLFKHGVRGSDPEQNYIGDC